MDMMETRRSFLRTAALALPVWLWPGARVATAAPPLDVRSLGARGDGKTTDTRTIQQAIDAAAAAGRAVRFPPGEYVSGTLRLRTGTVLQLDKGAALVASRDDGDFDSPSDRPHETHADEETSDFRSALLQGRDVARVRILGPGRIDGNRDSRGGPKPIALESCQAVEIRGLTIADAGNYAISLLGCDRVTIEDVDIANGYADGIDPDGCRDVLIARCRIETRDDALCLKTSLSLGVRRATERVRVVGCRLVTRHNAIKLGTESSGDFRDVSIRGCAVGGERHPWKGNLTAGIALETVDGGALERVTVSDVQMTGVRAPIFVRRARRGRGQRLATPGALRDISIRGITATGALLASSVTGVDGYAVERILLRDIRVVTQGGDPRDVDSLQVPEMESRYPDANMFPSLPAHGLYARHVAGLTIENLDLATEGPTGRAAVVLDDVRGARVRSVAGTTPPVRGALVWLNDVRDARIEDLRPRVGSTAVAQVSGAGTARVRLARRDGNQVVRVASEVKSSEVSVDGAPVGARTARR